MIDGDNPPAFPLPETGISHCQPGMTMLDYFAGQALLVVNQSLDKRVTAENAYDLAEYMLAERAKRRSLL